MFSTREPQRVIAINSVEKVLWLLKRFADYPYELSITDLAKEMGLAKSGVHKILAVLLKEGFVSQQPDTKKYCLGPALYRLGSMYSELKGIRDIAEPVMRALSQATEETVSIGIREGDDAILAYKIESPHAVRLHGRVGQKYPMNAGAIGKLLAAYHDPQKVKTLLQQTTFTKINSNTIVDPKILLEEYEKIRQQGYSVSNEENRAGAYGLAAPIFDKTGTVIACLCIAGPKERFTPQKVVEWTTRIISSAYEISYRLGYIDR